MQTSPVVHSPDMKILALGFLATFAAFAQKIEIEFANVEKANLVPEF